jgi:hypothetical protein
LAVICKRRDGVPSIENQYPVPEGKIVTAEIGGGVHRGIAHRGQATGSMKFWDASAIVPLLVFETQTQQPLSIAAKDSVMLVWWGLVAIADASWLGVTLAKSSPQCGHQKPQHSRNDRRPKSERI